MAREPDTISYSEGETISSLKARMEKLEKENLCLKNELELYEPLATCVNSGIAIIKDEELIFVNPVLEEYTGYTKQELNGKNFFELVDPTLRDDYRDLVKEGYLKEGDQLEIEAPIIRSSGERKWLRIFASMVGYKGELAAVITAFDYTEMRRIHQELEINEKKYRSVLDRNPNSIYLVDKETMRIMEANLALQDLLGYSEEELLSMTPYDFMENEGDMNGTVESSGDEGFSIVGDRRYRRKDGSLVDVSLNANLIDIGGREYICVVSWDITERKRYEAELKELNEILRLTARITRHDIRNRLAVSLGLLGLLKEKSKEKDPIVNEAHKSALKAVEITKRMNELESIAKSRQKKSNMDLGSVIEGVIKDFPVKYKISGSCKVVADEALRSVLENLVGNAVQHGGADLVQVDLKRIRDVCIMNFSDNGSGIPADIRDRIFNESFSHGESGGTGLGLYIVRRTIERYGGSIELIEPVLDGTTFQVRMPAAER